MIRKLFLTLGTVVLCMMVHAQSDFDIVKQRVVAEVLKSHAKDAVVSDLIENLKDDGSWPGINYEDVSNTGFENRIHLENMIEMSLAFNEESSLFYHSDRLAEGINRALKFWCDNDFITGSTG